MVSIHYLKQKVMGKKEVAEELPTVQNRLTGLGVITNPEPQENASARPETRSPSLESVRTVDLEKTNAAIEHYHATSATDKNPTAPALGKPTWKTLWLPRQRFSAVICGLLTVLAVVTVIVLAVELNKMPSMQDAAMDPQGSTGGSLGQTGSTADGNDPLSQPSSSNVASGFKPASSSNAPTVDISSQVTQGSQDSAPLGYVRMKTRSFF